MIKEGLASYEQSRVALMKFMKTKGVNLKAARQGVVRLRNRMRREGLERLITDATNNGGSIRTSSIKTSIKTAVIQTETAHRGKRTDSQTDEQIDGKTDDQIDYRSVSDVSDMQLSDVSVSDVSVSDISDVQHGSFNIKYEPVWHPMLDNISDGSFDDLTEYEIYLSCGLTSITTASKVD